MIIDDLRRTVAWSRPFAICIDEAKRRDLIREVEQLRRYIEPQIKSPIKDIRVCGCQIGSVRGTQ